MSRNRWDEPGPSNPSPTPGVGTSAAEAAERAAAIALKLTGSLAPKPVPVKQEERDRDKNQFDGEFTHDIEINDLRNRYLLTKGATQQQIHQDTGASITTKGVWLPDKSKATAAEPPLYLHIAAMTKEVLDIAVGKVQDLINQELGPLVEDRSQWARNRERFGQQGQPPLSGANASPAGGGGDGSPQGPPGEGGPGGQMVGMGEGGGYGPGRGGYGGGGFGGRGGFGGGRGGFGGGGGFRGGKWPEEKIFINLESLRNFNVRAKVVGPAGMFVKHIQQETGTRVQIKGQGSGFYEQETGREGEDPMHISISGPDENMIERAKLLADDLLLVVRSEWTKARDANNQQQPGGYGQQPQYNAQAYYQAYAQQQQQPAPPVPSGEAPPPPPETDAPPPPPSDGNAAPSAPTSAPAAAVDPAGPAAAASTPVDGAAADDPAEAYRKYWAAYGYDVNDPAFQAWQAQQYGYSAAQADPAAAATAAAGTPAQPAEPAAPAA